MFCWRGSLVAELGKSMLFDLILAIHFNYTELAAHTFLGDRPQ